MLNEPSITIMGRLTADPEMRFTPTGQATARFAVVCNPRQMSGGNWTDGTPVFLPVICWRDLAENVCESLRRGDPVVVIGKFRQRNWETREGEKRTGYEIQADTVTVPLDRHTVKLTKTTRERAESGQADSEPSGQADSEPSGQAGPTAPASAEPAAEPAAAQPGTDASASAGNGSAASTAAPGGKRRARTGSRSAT